MTQVPRQLVVVGADGLPRDAARSPCKKLVLTTDAGDCGCGGGTDGPCGCVSPTLPNVGCRPPGGAAQGERSYVYDAVFDASAPGGIRRTCSVLYGLAGTGCPPQAIRRTTCCRDENVPTLTLAGKRWTFAAEGGRNFVCNVRDAGGSVVGFSVLPWDQWSARATLVDVSSGFLLVSIAIVQRHWGATFDFNRACGLNAPLVRNLAGGFSPDPCSAFLGAFDFAYDPPSVGNYVVSGAESGGEAVSVERHDRWFRTLVQQPAVGSLPGFQYLGRWYQRSVGFEDGPGCTDVGCGACCLPNGLCVKTSRADCGSRGGVFSAGASCADGAGGCDPVGRCDFAGGGGGGVVFGSGGSGNGGSCMSLRRTQCQRAGGTWSAGTCPGAIVVPGAADAAAVTAVNGSGGGSGRVGGCSGCGGDGGL